VRFLCNIPKHLSVTTSRKKVDVFCNSDLDVLLQYLGFGSLGISEIHHLIEQLIDDDKVVSYTLFLKLFEVLCKHLDDLVEEKEDLGSICISFGKREEVEIVVSYVEILPSISAGILELHKSRCDC
jgi:hypothetical protein